MFDDAEGAGTGRVTCIVSEIGRVEQHDAVIERAADGGRDRDGARRTGRKRPGECTAGAPHEDSALQKDRAAKLRALLDQSQYFEFKDQTLTQVTQYFEQKTNENFVLDPVALRLGTLDPGAKVTGGSRGAVLRESLRALVEPLKLVAVVRDEVIVIESARRD